MFKKIINLIIILLLLTNVQVNANNINNDIEKEKALALLALLELENEPKPEQNNEFKNRIKVTDNNKVDLINRTKIYFSKYFPNSPVSPEYLVNLAQEYDFPLDFIILNGHLESHMCTAGRGAISKNCHNINNTDAGDYKPTVCGRFTQCNSKYEIGEIQFIELIKHCYMNKGELITLQAWLDRDFRIVRTVKPYCSAPIGARYMTDTKSLYKYKFGITNWINPIFGDYQKE